MIGLPLPVEWTARGVRRRDPGDPTERRSRVAVAAGTAVVLLIAIIGTQFGGAAHPGRHCRRLSVRGRQPAAESRRGRDLLGGRRAHPTRPIIAGNPIHEIAPVSAFVDRAALFPHLGGRYPEEHWAVAEGLSDGDPPPARQPRRSAVKYVLDFGDHFVFANDRRAELYPRTHRPDRSVRVTLLAEHGTRNCTR